MSRRKRPMSPPRARRSRTLGSTSATPGAVADPGVAGFRGANIGGAAGVTCDYISSYLTLSPTLKDQLDGEPLRKRIKLLNGTEIRTYPCRSKTARSYSFPVAVSLLPGECEGRRSRAGR